MQLHETAAVFLCKMAQTYVDAPKFLDTVEADDLLQQLRPVLLATWWLGEPQSPGVLKLMLDIEIRRIVKHGHDLLVIAKLIISVGGSVRRVGHRSIWRNWNGVKWHRFSRVGCWSETIRSHLGHDDCIQMGKRAAWWKRSVVR